MKRIILFGLVWLLAGCSEPTIDGSTDESMRASVDQVRSSLPADQQQEFEDALQVLAFGGVDSLADLVAMGASGGERLVRDVRQAVDGKTAKEVITAAAQVREQRREREREQALAEIEELQQRQQQTEQAWAELEKFEVLRSRFYKREREFMGVEPIIEITVRNGTSHAVSRAYFEGTIASPGRSVPWLQEDFNYSISGGLEPGEEASWTLVPNRFSKWGTVDVPEGAVFTAVTYRLDGPNGEKLFSGDDFTQRDEERLAQLLREYGH